MMQCHDEKRAFASGNKCSGLVGLVLFVCLFVLMPNVPVSNLSVMSGRGHHFLGIFISTFRGVNVSFLKDTTGRL